MPAGLQVFLDDGTTVQVDDKYFNLAFVGKYQVACTPNYTNPSGSITVSGTMPVVAFSGPVAACMHSMSQANGSFTFNFIVASQATLTVYLFDVPTNTGTFGMQIFNDLGQVTFDSSRLYMKIAHDISFSDYVQIPTTPIPNPGRPFAILCSEFVGYKFGQMFMPGESGPVYFETEINTVLYRVDSSNLYMGEVMTFRSVVSYGQQQDWSMARRSGQVQIIDVTGL